MSSRVRRSALLALLVLGIAACVVACSGDGSEGGAAVSAFVSADEDARDARVERLRRSSSVACNPARRFNAIRTGAEPLCAPFDSVSSVDDPELVLAHVATELSGDEPVIALAVDGEHRAYPVRYLIFHEIVNDTLAGVPVVVTFCPLCNSAVAHERRLDGKTLTFGVSGRLEYANLVMFDRETASFWQQMTGLATSGELAERRLEPVPVQMIPFAAWRSAHPDGLVLAAPDPDAYRYGTDPYGGYDTDPAEQSPVLRQSAGPVKDTRLSPKWRVLGAIIGQRAIAFPMPEGGAGRRLVEARVEGVPLVAIFEHGTIEAQTDRHLLEARRGWAGSAWIARAGDRDLAFEVRGDAIVETGSGTTFDLLGRGTSGELDGVQLEAPQQMTSFWFSWAHFYPETELSEQP